MVFPFNNPPQFNVWKQANNNYHKFILILFSSGPGAEKKKKRYKVVAFPTLLTMIVSAVASMRPTEALASVKL